QLAGPDGHHCDSFVDCDRPASSIWSTPHPASRRPMPSPQADPDVARRAVRLWLFGVAALIFLIVLVGGATRLPESGLSIVEWRPLTGAVPPLSAAQWQSEFEKYQTIPQYRLVTRGMKLADFKTIYWWEWGHRLLGRLIGAAFLLPF